MDIAKSKNHVSIHLTDLFRDRQGVYFVPFEVVNVIDVAA